ncbi:MAG: hypothetical protein JWP82_2282 [Humibacillus sp.]|nr:hypothetical protein [Humibacillus sp.]
MLHDMRFADLPADWAQRPITDPEVFEGVVDLIVAEQTRADGATYVLFCHEGGRLMQPLCVPDEPLAGGEGPMLERLTRMLTEAVGQRVHDVVMVIARPGRPTPTARDHDRRVAFEGACRAAGARLLGVAIAASAGVLDFPADGPVAA